MEKIEIGDKVKCKVSKLEGIVTTLTTFLHGVDRLGIHYGLNRDGAPLDLLYIDEPQASLLNKKEVERIEQEATTIILGSKVKDPISGLEGIAYGKAGFLYGCTRILVCPKLDKDGKKMEGEWFDANQLKVVKKEVVPQGSKKTGGPMTSIPTKNSNPR